MHRPRAAITAIFVLAALSAALPHSTARADVEGEVRSKDKVIGTILPATETERFAVPCPQGSKLKVKLKAPKQGGALSFRVLDVGGVVIPGLPIVPKKNGATLKGYTVPASGAYTVEVFAVDGLTGGDYALKVICKAPKKRSFTDTVDDAETEYTFFALLGTTLRAKLKPGRDSGANPRLLRLDGPAGMLIDFTLPAAGVKTDKIVLPDTGEYMLVFHDDGASGGDVSGKVSLKEAKLSKRTVDVRSGTIDPSGQGSERAVVGVIGGEGGEVVVPPDVPPAPNGIGGAALEVPPGAVSGPTAFVVATAPPIGPPDDDLGAGGPTVFFGPEGIQFNEDATVTIPFDPDLAMGDPSNIVVYTRDAEGNVTAVPPELVVVNLETGRATFPVGHFSAFRAFFVEPPLDVETLLGDLDPDPPLDIIDAAGIQGVGDLIVGSDPPRNLLVARGDVLELVTEYAGNVDVGTFAGGGIYTTPGTPVQDFDFGGPLTCVARGGFFQEFVCATETQAFRLLQSLKSVQYEVFPLAGTGERGDDGDGGSPEDARFTSISSLAIDSRGRVFIVDRGARRIRVIDPQVETIEPLMGTGVAALGGDGEPLADSALLDPTDIQVAFRSPEMYVADGGRVRLIDPGFDTGGVERNETFAGDAAGARGTSGDGESRLLALFDTLRHLALDPGRGRLLVADEGAHTLRSIDFDTGVVRLVVGTPGTAGDSGDSFTTPGPIDTPTSVIATFDRLFFTDTGNARIRWIELPGLTVIEPPPARDQ